MRGIPPGELRNAMDRLLEAGRRVIVQGPIDAPAAAPGLLRAGIVDHRALLPRAALAVHHGGAGTSHAVAAAGIPSVVVPHVGDQAYWADRLNRLGVAPRPIALERLDAQSLAEAVLAAAADHSMREKASGLAVRVGAEDGIGASVKLLQKLAAGEA
jgi:sterol 3beta-glucosyltransferase/vancomycin aglycone glucosyltransferase